ncbi:MAG: hypothetical protein FJ009_21590 [Chloroflexi bacterium]|nr:hypothetical protein [Chloroflexota bacterium]
MANRVRVPKDFDLTPYAGRWVAIVRGNVTGVGMSAREARLASKHQRPKEEPRVVFVPEVRTEDQRPTTE